MQLTHQSLYQFLCNLRESTDASEEIKVMFVDEIFRIETRSSNGSSENGGDEEVVARMKKPDCDWCKDNPRRKCKHCACSVCGGKNDPDKQILCDECDMAYHLWCLSPPLDTVPDVDEWYVSTCTVCDHYQRPYWTIYGC